MNSVAVVVLNWNGIDDTTRCLSSLGEQSYRNFKIVLIDNGSTEPGTDDKLERLKKEYNDHLHIIRNERNDGFAGGVNIGVDYALENDYELVALLNNDAVADPAWLTELVEQTTRKDVGIVTGLLLHEDRKTIDSTGDWYSIWGLPFPRGRNLGEAEAPKSGYVFGGTGGASLYKLKMLRDIGTFDEKFFAYYEDVDVSFRAQLRGWRIYYTDKAIAYHKRGASSEKVSGFTTYQTMKNLPLLFIKNVPRGLLLKIGVRFYFAYFLFLLNTIRKGSFFAALRGLIVGFYLFWTHALPARFAIQRTRRISTKELSGLLWHDLPPDQTGLRKLLRR